MFDLDDAAKRLEKDQQKFRRGRKELVTSSKAKREAEYRRKQQERLRQERERKQQQERYQQEYLHNCDRSLKVKQLAQNLQPTSIWGDGDKIALPPSLLETLTAEMSNNTGNPWIFRIGILNPKYQVPASLLVQTMKPPPVEAEYSMMDDDSDDDDDDDETNSKEAYLDELSYKYLAYTHCTVVEFTQDEGHIGIPKPIAEALLDEKRRRSELQGETIPTTRTKDPAAAASKPMLSEELENANDKNDESVDTMMAKNIADASMEEEKTPGHLAWGAFDIPDVGLEVSLVNLPKGKGCTLVPTKEAVQNGFYGLKDVKLVLEQSLIRTRATLGVGDTVSTWHRGVEYDLRVTKVIPSTFHAVTCINTDIEVDIGQVEGQDDPMPTENDGNDQQETAAGHVLGGGQTLGSSTSSSAPTQPASAAASSITPVEALIPEPPQDQKEGVCTVQISASGKTGRRRFDVGIAKMKDLFAFAATISGSSVGSFQLVTRFPRNVYVLGDGSKTLAEAGIAQGREAFMVEPLS